MNMMKIYEVPVLKTETELTQQELEIAKARMMTYILSGFNLNAEPSKIIE